MIEDPRTIIATKRDGGSVPVRPLERLVQDYAEGRVADGPMGAFLMACVLRGMDAEETAAMTRAFVASGTTVELGGIGRPVVDKHSTGGVGDAVSLVFAPLVAALGLACVKISGRGLGHTGGTIDKLEAIPGFRTDIVPDALREQAMSVGCVIAAQTEDLVPADGAVYALRDATATVRSTPLIAASVMAKKLAIASDLIVLDVKAGSGAFMADPREAAQLVDACLAIARRAGRDAAAAITDMSQPLGTTIGNALEVAEAIEVLRGQRAGRLRDLSVWLAGRALARLTRVDVDTATDRAAATLSDGTALEALRAMIAAQHGDPAVIDDPWSVLPAAPVRAPIESDRAGFLDRVDAAAVGEAAARLGAGRRHKHEPIDPAVGIVLTPKVGDRIELGAPVGTVHARDAGLGYETAAAVLAALGVADEPVEEPPLVYAWSEEVR